MDVKTIRKINLRELIRQCGGKAELARATGVNEVYLSQIDGKANDSSKRPPKVKGRRNFNVGDAAARKLERGMGKPHGWMDIPHPEGKEELAPATIKWIPVRTWIEAARDQGGSIVGAERVPVDGKVISDRSFALRVRGESMVNPAGRPSYPPGCAIIVDPDREPRDGDRVIVKIPGVEEATFKVYTADSGRILLRSYAPQIPAIEWVDGMRLLGVVVKTIIDDV